MVTHRGVISDDHFRFSSPLECDRQPNHTRFVALLRVHSALRTYKEKKRKRRHTPHIHTHTHARSLSLRPRLLDPRRPATSWRLLVTSLADCRSVLFWTLSATAVRSRDWWIAYVLNLDPSSEIEVRHWFFRTIIFTNTIKRALLVSCVNSGPVLTPVILYTTLWQADDCTTIKYDSVVLSTRTTLLILPSSIFVELLTGVLCRTDQEHSFFQFYLYQVPLNNKVNALQRDNKYRNFQESSI